MDHVLPLRVTPVRRYCVKKAANVPFGFLSTIDVEVALAMGSGAIPLRVELDPVERNIALATSLLGTLNQKRKGLQVVSRDHNGAIEMSSVQNLLRSSRQK